MCSIQSTTWRDAGGWKEGLNFYVAVAFRVRQKRSQFEWTLDLSYLKEIFGSDIQEKKDDKQKQCGKKRAREKMLGMIRLREKLIAMDVATVIVEELTAF